MTRFPVLTLALCLAACTPPSAGPATAARRTAALAAPAQKVVLDAMDYDGQPDRRGVGMQPLFVVYDGVLNRGTVPEADNSGRLDSPGAIFVARRVARDALRIEHPGIPQAQWGRPPAYDGVSQSVCLDVENAALLARLYTENVDDADRRAAAAEAAQWVLAAKAEARYYGKTVEVGAYCPLLPYANDPRAAAAAEADWKPYLDLLDAAYPDSYIHGPDLAPWKADTRASIDRCKRLLPGRPVYPFICPHYADRAPEGIRWQFMPIALWRQAVEFLLSQEDVAGVVVWGGLDFKNPGPGGVNRLPWALAAPYQKVVTDAAKRLGKPPASQPVSN